MPFFIFYKPCPHGALIRSAGIAASGTKKKLRGGFLFLGNLPFPQDPRQIHEGRVKQAGGDVNHVAGNCDGNQRGRVEEAGESEDVENSDVDRLAYEGGAVVAQPQKAALVSA